MDETLYDEFGNYIGPDLKSSDEEDSDSEQEDEDETLSSHEEDDVDRMDTSQYGQSAGISNGMDSMVLRDGPLDGDDDSNAIVLHEDKKYYPDASEVYGDVETLVMEEDSQSIETPIIAPVKIKSFSVLEKEIPETTYETEFMASLMEHPNLIRNVAVVGDLHHGKSSFVDLFVEHTHEKSWDPLKEVRYTDSLQDEQERKISIKSTPVSLILESSKGKSFLINLIDCPGHVNFADESTAAIQVADGAVLVVDAIEGVLSHTKKIIKRAVLAKVPIVLVINKVDRLIVELKLPPEDAYHKLVHLIEDVNNELNSFAGLDDQQLDRISPQLGNVCFASSQHGWCFSLTSFSQIYADAHKGVDTTAFAKRMWGNLYYSPETRTFKKKAPYPGAQRSFVQFILEPIYKIYSQVLGEDAAGLSKVLNELGIRVRREELHLNPRPLLRLVMPQFVGKTPGFVDMITTIVPSPVQGAEKKVETLFTGSSSSEFAKAMRSCDANGPLMINIVKLYSTPDGTDFTAFGRIFSGTVAYNQRVKVLGEAFSEDDDEDMMVCDVTGVSIGQSRYRIELNHLTAGNLVLLEGVHSSIMKTGTITDANDLNGIGIFRPLQFDSEPVMKLAVEPLNPAELPKMLEGLRKVNKSYPLARTKVEESGEHIILCTGELSADCIMHDLRKKFSNIEIKVADPVVSFCETVIETSSVQCFAETPNKKNKLTMIAEPLDSGLAEDIESGEVKIEWKKKVIGDFFQTKYDWDLLAARSVWAFGPESNGPNLLIDDTLSGEVDKTLVNASRDNIVQGFQWACREGPLCDEPIRNTKFKLLNTVLAQDQIHRGGGQIIPTARRVAYSSFLMATPRLMEPIYSLEILCPADVVSELHKVLTRRRGHITHDSPIPGSPLYRVTGFIPVIESFGFETDLRVFSQGQAFCTQAFDHWSVVPGDPLDRSIVLRPLEPSPTPHLAREFMVKSRLRKGLSQDVSIDKFFDDPALLQQLASEDPNLQNLLHS